MASPTPSLLIADDDSMYANGLKSALAASFSVHLARNGDEALDLLKKHSIQAILLDVQMRTPIEGLDYLPKIRAIDPETPVIMLTGHTELGIVRKAMQLGAWDFLSKDSDPIELRHTLDMALEKARIIRRSEQKSLELARVQGAQPLIGGSPSMQRARSIIERIRPARGNVVIFGETGTGKEVVARQLRKRLANGELEPFVAIDSSTIQSSTAESILFGHQKGAFTGADQLKKGVFEEADGGIVYFDEIANMPLEIQAKLLRVVQEKEVMRLGSSKPISLEFRVICATNKDLEKLVEEGRFKEDLYQRLNVLPIEMPALRDRLDDVPELFVHFVNRQGYALTLAQLDSELVNALKSHRWPGNVRELANAVSYALTMCELSNGVPKLTADSLPPKVLSKRSSSSQELPSTGTLSERLEAFEISILKAELELALGNVAQAAQKLGLDRSNLHKKLKGYGLLTSR
jgi:DNA-binding NtrC family response regulator